jgi:hypothetical protein
MGKGKTEAAMFLADWFNSNICHRCQMKGLARI